MDTSSFRTYLYLVFYGFITGSYLTLFERLFHNGFVPHLPRYHSVITLNFYRTFTEGTPKKLRRKTEETLNSLMRARARTLYII